MKEFWKSINTSCTAFSCWARADGYLTQRQNDETDANRRLDTDADHGQLQRSASVVNGNDASAPSLQQMTADNARSPGMC